MPDIRLPDGSIRSFPGPVTVTEIAQAIGAPKRSRRSSRSSARKWASIDARS